MILLLYLHHPVRRTTFQGGALSKKKLTNTEKLRVFVQEFQSVSAGTVRNTTVTRDEMSRLRKELAPLLERRLRFHRGLSVNPYKLWIDAHEGGGLDVYLFENVPRGRKDFEWQRYMHFFINDNGTLVLCHRYRTKKEGKRSRENAQAARR